MQVQSQFGKRVSKAIYQKQNTKKSKGLGVWINWQSTCLVCGRPWIQSPELQNLKVAKLFQISIGTKIKNRELWEPGLTTIHVETI